MVTWKQRLQGATLYALKFIKTIKSKENKTMENVFYKSYKELVSEYFGIDYKVGENAPKLSKQLSKKGIAYTQEELQAFSELLLAVFSDCKELVYTFKLSDILPSYKEAEDWAFDGSCNEPGGAGELTSIALQTSDLARYCYIFNENNSPKARFYYLEDEQGELGLSDMYSWEGHGFYLAPQILLAIFYNRKLSDFQETRENIVYENNSGGFWCNMASEQYKKFVTDTEISADVDLDKAIDVLREEGFVWSDNQDRYINLDDEDFTFCENIEDFEELYYVNTCEHCGCPFSVNGDYAEVQGNYFCSDDCASMECVWSEYYSEYILIDDSSCCDDCGDSFYHDDMEEGSDGCLYCSDCIHDHLEDEEEIA